MREAVPAQTAQAIWPEMRLHLEWATGLSLVFLFADSAAAVAPLARWTDDAWVWRTAPLQRVVPTDAEQAGEAVWQALQQHLRDKDLLHAPVWVELLAVDDADGNAWETQRRELLARLNEHREWLSRSFARPLVLCLPTAWWGRVAEQAPDLWHVRSYTACVASEPPASALHVPGLQPRSASLQQHLASACAGPRATAAAAEAAYQAAPGLATLRAWWQALVDLADAALEASLVAEAVAVATGGLGLARRLVDQTQAAPAALRDLSVSLNKVGDAEREAGRGEAALAAYRESLEICRQLRQALGDGPQVLRDLSVSSIKVGDAESQAGRSEAALAAYRESLEICRRLRQALGDAPQVLDDLAVSLERMSRVPGLPLIDRRAWAVETRDLRHRLVAAFAGSTRHRLRLAVAQAIVDDLAAGDGRAPETIRDPDPTLRPPA